MLSITPIFDGTITKDANAAAIEGAIDSAIQTFDTRYSSPFAGPFDVSIYFQEGGGLGTSDDVAYGLQYTAFYNQLVAVDANPQAIAALNQNGGDALTNGGVNPVGGKNVIEIKAPNARALGIDIPPGCYVTAASSGSLPNECALTGSGTPVDGIISLNTSLTHPPQGSSDYNLTAVAEHEIDEVLGLGSALENCPGNTTTGCNTGKLTIANATPFGVGSPEDLFRWSAPSGGTRSPNGAGISCSSTSSAYFEYGPNTGEIAQFNNACNGADFGDWASNPLPHGASPDVQDAYGTAGIVPAYGQDDIDAMTAIGYTYALPEPSTWLAIFPAGALFALRRLLRRA